MNVMNACVKQRLILYCNISFTLKKNNFSSVHNYIKNNNVVILTMYKRIKMATLIFSPTAYGMLPGALQPGYDAAHNYKLYSDLIHSPPIAGVNGKQRWMR